MGAACTRYTKPAPFITHTPPFYENPTCHLAQQGSDCAREREGERERGSWHVVVLYIHDKYLHTNLLTMCHVGIGGREKQLPDHDTDSQNMADGEALGAKTKQCLWQIGVRMRGKHGSTSTRNREILVQDYRVGDGLRQGCWVGGRELVRCCTRAQKCTNTHCSSGSAARTKERSCPLFPRNTTKEAKTPHLICWKIWNQNMLTCSRFFKRQADQGRSPPEHVYAQESALWSSLSQQIE